MPPDPAHSGHHSARPRLVERDEALGVLTPAIQLASPDDAAIILVVGEIGAGKTEVIRSAFETGDNQNSNGIFRARVACHSSSPSYAPWVSLIERHDALAKTIPEPLGSRTPAAQGPNDLIRQTVRAIRDLAAQQPMTLVFDDIQWADAASLDLLLAIATEASGLPLTLVIACETPLREGDPIASFVPTLLREAPAHSIELPSLTGDGIRQIVNAHVSDIPDELAQALAEHVQQWSGGNPLYAVEMLEGIKSERDVEATLATRRLDTLSFSLKHLAEYRLEQLSDRARATIELASIIGDTFDLELLENVSDLHTEELIRDLEEALDAGILIEEPGDRLRFRYGLVRQLLTETQSSLRRRQRHRAVLEALQKSRRPRISSLDIALHAEAAGELEIAVDAFEQAGHQATRFFNMPDAAQHYRKAFRLAEQNITNEARQDMLRLQYADSLVRSDAPASIREYEKVAARAFVRDDLDTRGKARQRHATILYETGRRDEARDILTELIPELKQREDWQTLADGLVCALYCAATDSDLGTVDSLVQDLESILDKVENPGYRALALAMKATADVARGEPGNAPGMMRDAVAIMEELGRLDMAAPYTSVAFMRVDLFANLHRPEQIRDLIAWGRRLDEEGNRRVGLGPAPCECTPEFGFWYLLRGEWNEAEEFLLDPIQTQNEPRPQARKENISVIGAEYAFARGELDEASTILDFLAPSPSSPAAEHGYQPWIMAADLRTRIAIEEGRVEEAQGWINALDRALEHKPHVPGELILDLNRARLMLAHDDAESAEQISDSVIARARRINNMLPLIDGWEILAIARQKQGDGEQARRAIEQAIGAAARCHLHFIEDRCRITSYEIAGTSGSIAPVELEAIEALHRQMVELGARRTAERLERLLKKQSNKRPGNLTNREMDVLRLIVNGKTDNDIAETLFISPRTVSTHVGNMLGKANVSNRVELTSWAHHSDILNN